MHRRMLRRRPRGRLRRRPGSSGPQCRIASAWWGAGPSRLPGGRPERCERGDSSDRVEYLGSIGHKMDQKSATQCDAMKCAPRCARQANCLDDASRGRCKEAIAHLSSECHIGECEG